MIKTTLQAGLVQLQALANYIDQGSRDATFVVYSNNKPASVADAVDPQAELIRFALPKPSLRSVNADSISLKQTEAALVTRAGVAQWARLYNGNGDPVADFAFGSDIEIQNPELALGSTLMFNVITLRPSV